MDVLLMVLIPLVSAGIESDDYATRDLTCRVVELCCWLNIPEPFQELKKSRDINTRNCIRNIRDNLRSIAPNHFAMIDSLKDSPRPNLLAEFQDRYKTITGEQPLQWGLEAESERISGELMWEYVDKLIEEGVSPIVVYWHVKSHEQPKEPEQDPFTEKD